MGKRYSKRYQICELPLLLHAQLSDSNYPGQYGCVLYHLSRFRLVRLTPCPYNSAKQLSLGTVIVVYDTLITLSHEVEYIWLKNVRLGTILYLSTRYGILIFQGLQVIGITGALAGTFSPQVFRFMTLVDNDSHVLNLVGSVAFLYRWCSEISIGHAMPCNIPRMY